MSMVLGTEESRVTVGTSVLALVTSGMYNDPMAIYREYIQNAVDELARVGASNAKVKINIDQQGNRVSIRDNGPGLTYEECIQDLLPLAQSRKLAGTDRGFRGIGRLCGLAFAQKVTFTTRSNKQDPVTQVVWSVENLPSGRSLLDLTKQEAEDLVSVEVRSGKGFPTNFFQVDVEGVARHARGSVLNKEAVRSYIGEVCPVPFGPEFPYAKRALRTFPSGQTPYSIRVYMDDDSLTVLKPYGSSVPLTGDQNDDFQEFEEVRIPSIDGRDEAAVGWIAHSSYRGAIPKVAGIRGIRARAGNIQIGDEKVFDHLFEEDRFNRWCIGEVHVLDPHITPNARRDYFEREPHLRNLENHLAPIFRRIGTRCRAASSKRNKERKVLSTIDEIEDMHNLAATGFLDPESARTLVEKALDRTGIIREDILKGRIDNICEERVNRIESKLLTLEPGEICFPIDGIPSSEVKTYRKIFQALLPEMPSPGSAKRAMEALFQMD